MWHAGVEKLVNQEHKPSSLSALMKLVGMMLVAVLWALLKHYHVSLVPLVRLDCGLLVRYRCACLVPHVDCGGPSVVLVALRRSRGASQAVYRACTPLALRSECASDHIRSARRDV